MTNSKLVKASMGAVFTMPIIEFDDTFMFGISGEWYSCNPLLLSIPMLGVCDSLNEPTEQIKYLFEFK